MLHDQNIAGAGILILYLFLTKKKAHHGKIAVYNVRILIICLFCLGFTLLLWFNTRKKVNPHAF